jgi:hypothetical protein
MIAAELVQRYAQGESLNALALEYHLCNRTIAKTVRAMGGGSWGRSPMRG